MNAGIFDIIKEDKHRFGIPNLLTTVRLLFLPFIVYFIRLGSRKGDICALLFMFFSCLTDYFDGYLARKLNQQSNLGRMLDPIVDKISIATAMLVLASQKGLPYWYVFIVIGRDLWILFASTLVISKKRFVIESNKLGKWTSSMFALIIISFTLNIPTIKWIFVALSLLLIPATIVGYTLKYKDDIPKRKNKQEN